MLPLHRNDGMEPKRHLAYAMEIADFYWMQIVAKKFYRVGGKRGGSVGFPETRLLFFLALITLLPSLIARGWVGCQTQWWPRHKAIYFSWLGSKLFCLLLGPPGFNCWFSLLQYSSGVVWHPRDLQVSVATGCFCRVLIFVLSQYKTNCDKYIVKFT